MGWESRPGTGRLSSPGHSGEHCRIRRPRKPSSPAHRNPVALRHVENVSADQLGQAPACSQTLFRRALNRSATRTARHSPTIEQPIFACRGASRHGPGPPARTANQSVFARVGTGSRGLWRSAASPRETPPPSACFPQRRRVLFGCNKIRGTNPPCVGAWVPIEGFLDPTSGLAALALRMYY